MFFQITGLFHFADGKNGIVVKVFEYLAKSYRFSWSKFQFFQLVKKVIKYSN